MKHVFLLFIFILFPSLISSQSFSKDERRILELQDLRSLGINNELIKYLNSKDEIILIRTLIASANIQDTSIIERISELLNNHTNEFVRASAAFALGQFNNPNSVKVLLKALEKENNKEVIIEIIKAIGLSGNVNDLNRLLGYKSTEDEVIAALANSISRFAYRKIKNENAVNKIKEIINSTDHWMILKYSAYALLRIGDKNLLEPARNEILKLTLQDHQETRMWAYIALGRLKNIQYLQFLLEAFEREGDWKLKVSILNAIGNTDNSLLILNDSLVTKLFSTSESSNNHVSITSLNVIGKIFEGIAIKAEIKQIIKNNLQWYFNPTRAVDWQIKSEAVKTYAKIFKDDAKDDLMSYYSMTTNYDIKADIIRSFSNMSGGLIYKEVRDIINTDVQNYNEQRNITSGEMISGNEMAKLYKAFVELVYSVSSKVDDENKNTIRLILSEFLGSGNPAIVDICITGLKDSIFINYRNETSQLLLFDYNDLQYPQDFDIMQMYITAMGDLKVTHAKDLLEKNLLIDNYDIAKASADALLNITGVSYENKIKTKKYKTDFDWNFMKELNKKRFANILTNRGLIKIELYFNEAPFTVQNFVKLAEKHYFNNIIFHRVVPNFVVQCGDPTGTGYSGPGYSIRTEIIPWEFEPYVVGMASSGKDTEGSQFFITHSSQPHLDTRYTIFGIVFDGQQVVDEIQFGDYIQSITFSEN